MPRRSPSRSPSPDPKRRKQSHSYSNTRPRSPSPTRYSRQGSRRGDDRRDSRDYRYDDRGAARDSYRGGDRDRDRGGRHDRYDDRDSRAPRDTNGRRRSRSRSPPPPANGKSAVGASVVDSKSNGSATPAVPATPAISAEEEEKLKAKRARLEAWKKEQGAKKALNEAKAKAAALASGRPAPAASEFNAFDHEQADFTPLDHFTYRYDCGSCNAACEAYRPAQSDCT